MGFDFEEWFAEQGFFHENTAREKMNEIMEYGRVNGIDPNTVLGIVETAFAIMRNEYGD